LSALAARLLSRFFEMMSKESRFKTFYALSVAWQLGFLIAVPIGGFMLLGFLGDKFFKVKPLLLILGLLVGVIITIYETYHLFIPLIENKKE
jgi:F0F1-type ATP synthase assembly protein I